MLSSLRISLFAIAIAICATSVAQTGGYYSSVEKTPEEWDKARSEMCADIPSAKLVKTEAATDCPECIAKPLIGKMAEKLAAQSKSIKSNVQDQKDLLFYRDFFKNSAYAQMPKEQMKTFVKAYEQMVEMYENIYVTSDENKTLFALGENYAALKNGNPEKEKAKKQFIERIALIKQTYDAHKELGALLKIGEDSSIVFSYTSQMQALIEATKAIDNFDLSDESFANTQGLTDLVNKLVAAAGMPSAFTKKQTYDLVTMINDIIKAIEESKKGFPSEEIELERYRQFARKISSTIGMSKSFCGMSDTEQFAIVYYTGSGYANINAALRSEEKTPEAKAFKEILNKGLSKLKKFEGEVMRGASMPDSVLESYQVGAVVTHPSFTSTSKSVGFSGAQQFFIKSKKGHYIAPISGSPGEEEVLFSADSKFKVLKVEPMLPPSDGDDAAMAEAKKKALKITMEEVE